MRADYTEAPAPGAAAPAAGRPVTTPEPRATDGVSEQAPAGDLAKDKLSLPLDATTRPWRDQSGERQKITRKEMKLEAEDVEDAHERAVSIITKADGYVDTEELRINERGEGEAVISARVPVDALDGVVAQLRELGKVVTLQGESEDRTKEYNARGQSIRDLAEREMALVAQYEQEKDRYRKQQLYAQIQSVRAQIRGQKPGLLDLSDQTHFAFLNVTIVQATGPRQFLHRISGSVPTAAAWLAISAIFWVPLLVVVIALWRRVAAGPKAV